MNGPSDFSEQIRSNLALLLRGQDPGSLTSKPGILTTSATPKPGSVTTSDTWGDDAGPGVVGVSGGADSVALLRALAEHFPPDRLIIAHLNHGLRGPDSVADADFVRQLCPQFARIIETTNLAQTTASTGENLEAAGRNARYAFFERVATQFNARWVATGHTLDDQAETVLHRLLRGAGLRGLRGVAPRRELRPSILLVRPMLSATRTEVVDYLRSIGQDWREDASNADPAFTRNRLRHELLPLLRTFNPAANAVFARLAHQANELFVDLERDAESLLQRVELPRAGATVVLDRHALAGQTDCPIREMFILLWEREAWPRNDMTHRHWDRLVELVRETIPAWDFPGRVRVSSTGNVLRLERR